MYFTATSPYVFMAILLVRMALLDGARDGILFYLVPDFGKMTDIQVSCPWPFNFEQELISLPSMDNIFLAVIQNILYVSSSHIPNNLQSAFLAI